MKVFFLKQNVSNLLLIIFMLLCGHFQMSAAWEFDVNGLRYKETSVENMEVAVIGANDLDLEYLEIPATVVWDNTHTYQVTSIEEIRHIELDKYADSNPSKDFLYLETISIPSTVTKITDYAFHNFPSIKEIRIDEDNLAYCDIDGVLYDKDKTKLMRCPDGKTECIIPEGVTELYFYAFDRCKYIESITIPSSVSSLKPTMFNSDPKAFNELTNLKEIRVSENNENFTDIDGVLFNKDMSELLAYPQSGASEYSVPNTVNSIYTHAFSYCKSLQFIKIPESVKDIGEYAFLGCSSLTEFNLPKSVTELKSGILRECTSLKQFTIPESVTKINDHVFLGCSSLISVTIPNSVVDMGRSTFAYCSSLPDITIPSSVTTIGSNVFHYCTSLSHINIPSSVISIDDKAFEGCVNLESVDLNVGLLYIGSEAFKGCFSLRSIVLPEGFKAMAANEMFCGCTSLTYIIIPASTTYIGQNNAFTDCVSLKSIYSMNPTPPYASLNEFFDVPKDADIYIPVGSLTDYKNDEGWSYFHNFHEVEDWEAGISDITADEQDTPQDVYTPQGICVKQGATKTDIEVLPKGLYIVGGKKIYIK